MYSIVSLFYFDYNVLCELSCLFCTCRLK